jgi:cytoskeleton protein RodZ
MMEQLSENDSAQAGKSAATEVTSLGMTLREARQQLGLSVADVANQIKFAPRQIEALEADDFQHLPEAAFLRGFIRSYAKILQLDAQPLLAALSQSKTASIELMPAAVGVPFPDAQSLMRQNMVWLGAAGLLAVIAVGFALWNFISPLKQSQVVQVETPIALPEEMQIIPLVPGAPVTVSTVPDEAKALSSIPAAKSETTKVASPVSVTKPVAKPVAPTQAQLDKPEAKPEVKPEVKSESTSWWFLSSSKRDAQPDAKPESAAEIKPVIKPEAKPVKPLQAQTAKSSIQSDASSPITQLRLVFGAESWTEIKDRDGKIISSQVNPRGSELIVNGRAPFSMLIGHGLSVQLFHQGKPVDLTPYINKYSEVAHVTLQ